jgi:tetratricopeptide (TPR) repeat protein
VVGDWENVKGKAQQWEKESDPFPGPLSSLGMHYLHQKHYADAERCLKTAIVHSKTSDLYYGLANVYKVQEKTELWLSTLEEILNNPDYGLDHSRANETIAWHFMRLRQWDRALPYAERAAETYSAGGLEACGCCQEGRCDWAEAEKYFRAVVERYPTRNCPN